MSRYGSPASTAEPVSIETRALRVNSELHGDDYARGAPYDFAVSVTTDPRPAWLERAIADGVKTLGRYPDHRPATAAVARSHGRTAEEVVVLNGAAEAFTLVARELRPRFPVVVQPSFSEPERALRDAGLQPRRLILSTPFAFDPDSVPEQADLLVIGNPTNPTGVLHPAQALRRVCRPGRVTVVDEAFMDFVVGERETLAAARELPGLIVVRSMTKMLGVPGVRAGYLLTKARLAERLRRARPQWPVNGIALAAIEAAAERPDHKARIAGDTAVRRERLVAALERIEGIYVHPASANFVLLELPDAVAVYNCLRDRYGIATRPCWAFPGLDERHLRLAVRGQPLDGMLAEALAAVGVAVAL